MSDILEELLDRPIAVHRGFIKVTGCLKAALFLSQSFYWSRRTKDPDGWFYKTMDEWEDETSLTRIQQESARKKLRELGLLDEVRKGVPCKLYFKVNREKLSELLSLPENIKKKKPGQFGYTCMQADQHDSMPENQHTGQLADQQTYTETTTETTTDILSPEGELFPEACIYSKNQSSDKENNTNTKTRARGKDKKPVDECYQDFVKMWTEAYPDLGFNAVSGIKIKAMIKSTREIITGEGKPPDRQHVNGMFAYVLAFVKRVGHFAHGKPITTFEMQYRSVIGEIRGGKPQKPQQPPSSAIFSKYSNLM